MRVAQFLRESAVALAKAGVDTPEIDAQLLLGHCLTKSRTGLYLAAEEQLSESSLEICSTLIARRIKREPLAYIIGAQEFWSLDFHVTTDVLIPRPETEFLLEQVIHFNKKDPIEDGILVDLCCGSGAIAVVLAKELNKPVLAIDISWEALCVAHKNCVQHGVSHLVTLLHSDLLSAVLPQPCLSCVVSNPPYVSQESIQEGLQPEVAIYEPHLALDGGKKGMEIITKICEQLQSRLLPGGHLFMEIGTEQGEDVSNLFAEQKTTEKFFDEVAVRKDYAGHDRIFYTKFKK